MGGFAIYPAPSGRGNDDGGSRHSSVGSSSTNTRTSSISSLDGAIYDDDGHQNHHHPPGHTLETPPSSRKQHRRSPARLFQKLRTALPALTTLALRCGRAQMTLHSGPTSSSAGEFAVAARRPWRRVTGTLYGHRKGRVALALQETPRCVPGLVVELAIQTHALLRELGNPAGARIVLETERRRGEDGDEKAAIGGGGQRRRSSHDRRRPPLLDEPRWTMFCNGRKTGYAVRREATGDDLAVLETLRAVSMGAGVLPGSGSSAATSDEVPYMRGSFDHFVGSRDSESLYMVAPQGGGTGPELAVFFVRL